MVFKFRGFFNQAKLDQEKLGKDVLELLGLIKNRIATPEYEKIEDKVREILEESLNTPGKIEELANSENWMERLALAELLEITPDMPEKLVKEAKEAAKKLAHDPVWTVRFMLAAISNIEPNFFKEIAKELKNDKDWRVVIGLLLNDNTPEEIISWIEKNKKKVLGELERLVDFMLLLKHFTSLLRE